MFFHHSGSGRLWYEEFDKLTSYCKKFILKNVYILKPMNLNSVYIYIYIYLPKLVTIYILLGFSFSFQFKIKCILYNSTYEYNIKTCSVNIQKRAKKIISWGKWTDVEILYSLFALVGLKKPIYFIFSHKHIFHA